MSRQSHGPVLIVLTVGKFFWQLSVKFSSAVGPTVGMMRHPAPAFAETILP